MRKQSGRSKSIDLRRGVDERVEYLMAVIARDWPDRPDAVRRALKGQLDKERWASRERTLKEEP